MKIHWIDRWTAGLAPRWTMQRMRARITHDLLERHYEAAAAGRRTQGWHRSSADGNAAVSGALSRLRDTARDLVKNNAYAESALSTIADNVVGWGIVAKPSKSAKPAARNQAAKRWAEWADTTACDADGRQDFAGLQKLVMRAVVQDGEVLVRRRWRRPEDKLPIPMQLQVLEADFIDATQDNVATPRGGRIIQGVEFDPIGRRAGYWLFPEHPGSMFIGGGAVQGGAASHFVPASEILHVYKPGRPGQVRAASWFASVILTLKDLDDYEDAALMKQKIAACLAVMVTDIDGSSTPLGATTAAEPAIDMIEPGMIHNLPLGRQVTVVDPPSVSEHGEYTKTVLRKVATGLGVSYEDLTGSYEGLPFSAARMSRIRNWARVEDARWRMLIPQFCDPVWAWAMQAAVISGMDADPLPTAEWTAPPAPMIDPTGEGLAYTRNIRAGIMTLSEAIRERGYSPDDMLAEYAADNAKLDKLGIILDSDPRRTSQAGQPRETAKPGAEPVTPVATEAAASQNGWH